MRIIILCLFLPTAYTYDNSLCTSCASTLGTLCVACNPTGCGPYSTFDATTSTLIIIKDNAFAEMVIIRIILIQVNYIALDAL